MPSAPKSPTAPKDKPLFAFAATLPSNLSYEGSLKATEKVSPEHIRSLTKLRASLRTVLKTAPNAHQDIIKAVQGYLPYLFALDANMKTHDYDCVKMPIEFAWKSVLCKGAMKPTFTIPSIEFELHYTLLVLGFALYNHGAELTGRSSSSDTANQLAQASECILRAAGVFQYIEREVAPRWINLPSERPPEILKPAATALFMMCLADAQSLAVAKAVAAGTTSPGLLAKLCVDCAKKLAAAHEALRGMEYDYKDVSDSFRTYLTDKATYMLAHAEMLVAHDSAKNAYVLLQRRAVPGIEELPGSKYGLTAGMAQSAKTKWTALTNSRSEGIAAAARADLVTYSGVCDKYHRENETLYYEYVPFPQELSSAMPEGKCMVSSKELVLPSPAF
ncbi:hypothetical protein RI367_006135 [Sorochytrium milnesiophthora]